MRGSATLYGLLRPGKRDRSTDVVRHCKNDPSVSEKGHHRHFGAGPGMSAHAPDNGHPPCKSRRDEALKRKQGLPGRATEKLPLRYRTAR